MRPASMRKIICIIILCLISIPLLSVEGRADQKYKIKKGDTLYKIARNYGVSVKQIKQANALKRSVIKPGDLIVVPTKSSVKTSHNKKTIRKTEIAGNNVKGINNIITHKVRNGENLYKISRKYGVSVKEVKRLNNLSGSLVKVGQKLKVPGASKSTDDETPFSIELPRTAREQFKAGVRVSSKKELEIGDLIFFRTYAKFPSHVGIYIGGGKMIHASSRDKKVTVSSINEPFYVKRYIGAVRFPEAPSLISTKEITSVSTN